MLTNPDGGIESGLAVLSKGFTSEPRALSEDEIAGGLIRSSTADAIGGHVLPDPDQCICHYLPVDVRVGEDGLRMNVHGVFPLFDFDGILRTIRTNALRRQER